MIRTLRLSFFAALFFLPAETASQLWEARHDMAPAAFQAAFEELTPRGYVPYEISAVERDETVRFSAVWRHEPAVVWEARYDLTANALQTHFDNFTAQGYVPAKVIGYRQAGAVRYAAIWRREPGIAWEARWSISPETLQRYFDDWSPRGYAPRTISAYADGDEIRFAAIWRRDTGRSWEAHTGLTEAEYQAIFDRLAPQGYLPIDFAAYRVNGETRFVGVWEQVSGTSWQARHGMSASAYLDRAERLAAEGWAPYVVSAYPDGQDGVEYAAAWRFNAQPAPMRSSGVRRTGGPTPMRTGSALLPIQPVRQQTLVWCWLAVGEMLFRHFGVPAAHAGGDFQCGIIGQISGPTSPCWSDCYACVMPSGSNFGTLSMVANYSRLMGNRAFSYAETRIISPAEVIADIDAGRPVVAGTSSNRRLFDHDAEHVVLIVGYEVVDGRTYLVVNDPYPYPHGANPFLLHGGAQTHPFQYRIAYDAFRDGVFWHWTVHEITIG